jgi:hypothetical protein
MARRAVAAAMLASTVLPGHAAQIEVDVQTDPPVVAIVGDIKPNDADTFQAKTYTLSRAAVLLKSTGGNLVASIRIGEIVKAKGFPTAVTEYCMSACTSIWLAGSPRFMTSSARIGFHQAYSGDTRQVSGSGNALVGSYLTRLGLGYAAVLYATSAGPDQMKWMTPEEARQVGIDVTVLDLDQDVRQTAIPKPPTVTPSPPAQTPKPKFADVIQCTDKYPDAAPGTLCCPWDYAWDDQTSACTFSPASYPKEAYKPLFAKQVNCSNLGLARNMLCCPAGYSWDKQNNACRLQ